VTATVITTNSAHRIMKTSMPLLIQDLKPMFITAIPRYNLVMRSNSDNARATELRESMMALARQMRRHRTDTGLTLSQREVLGETSRSGAVSPAELAGRLQVRVQSLTDSINELEARGLVSRRPDTDDRRRQLIEVTAEGATLLDADRADRDAWLDAAMRQTLTELEFDLLMLVAPVLRKVADAYSGPAQ
jgi:DNA-binding MarR family transcriptional regulator